MLCARFAHLGRIRKSSAPGLVTLGRVRQYSVLCSVTTAWVRTEWCCILGYHGELEQIYDILVFKPKVCSMTVQART